MSSIKTVKAEFAAAQLVGFKIDDDDHAAGREAATKSGATKTGATKQGQSKVGTPKPGLQKRAAASLR
jgi:hypothetical protein